mmetsp:Transcript_35557/g.52960  ORF Transcript_35557/g.52960 Transcript_35557/m.52960 type:complete len:96 (-) Transcript_35557:39-326(-)
MDPGTVAAAPAPSGANEEGVQERKKRSKGLWDGKKFRCRSPRAASGISSSSSALSDDIICKMGCNSTNNEKGSSVSRKVHGCDAEADAMVTRGHC